MKKPLLLAGLFLLAAIVAIVATQPSVQVTPLHVFQLPHEEEVAFTMEVGRQHDLAVSFDRSKTIYLLEAKGWKFYKISSDGNLNSVALERPSGTYRDYPNFSISVNGDGSQVWCSSAQLIRAYSSQGKLIQQWEVPEIDIGYVQALDAGTAVVDAGGPMLIFKVGNRAVVDSPVRSFAVAHTSIDWNGVQCTIQKAESGFYEVKCQNVLRPDLIQDEKSVLMIQQDEQKGTPQIFWKKDSQSFYIETKQFGNKTYSQSFFHIKGRDSKTIVTLKQKNDPLLAQLGNQIVLNRPLWGEEDSVAFYAQEEKSRNGGAQKQYIMQVSLVPRWRAWFF